MSDPLLPSRRYADGVARGDWQYDPAQQPALLALDRVHAALQAPVPTRGVFQRLFGNPPPPAPRGLYLWGGVGRGKTFLIDLFFAGLPFPEKRRTHFHRFMRDVHQRLRDHAGERDPLAAIAREWRRCGCWCWTSSSSATSATRCCWGACWIACSPRASCW
jgi:cell division protein ZapE